MGAFAIKAHYTVREVAEILGVHNHTVYRYIKKGKLDAERLGRRYIIPLSSLYMTASLIDSMQLMGSLE
jgi:excisionase family DNA binding protein